MLSLDVKGHIKLEGIPVDIGAGSLYHVGILALWDVGQHPSPNPVDASSTPKCGNQTVYRYGEMFPRGKIFPFLTESVFKAGPWLATQSLLEALKRQAPPDSWTQCQNSWGGGGPDTIILFFLIYFY